jgi:hypothetical protein
MTRVLREKLWWFVAAAAVLFVLYLIVEQSGRRWRNQGRAGQAGAGPVEAGGADAKETTRVRESEEDGGPAG